MDKRTAILKPVLTEKSNLLRESGKYTFLIHPKLNKIEVKRVLKQLFNVDVTDCRIINKKGKEKMTRNGISKISGHKKAIISLKDGQKIDLFEV